MCNEIARRIALNLMREDFNELKIRLVFPDSLPNLPDLDSIRITDATAIVRAAAPGESGGESGAEAGDGAGAAELIVRRWSWPLPNGKPLYNFRSDGRELRNTAAGGRCLVPVSAFYEFTAPEPGAKRKTKWAFTHARDDWFAIGGLWRRDVLPEGTGSREAFTMLTCPPGPDVAPYHARQMVVVERRDWAGWLSGTLPSAEVCVPLAEGTLRVERVG